MFMDMAMLVESQVIVITYIDVLIILRVLSKLSFVTIRYTI